MKYELTFVGSAMVRDFPRYRRWHATMESAETTAKLVRSALQEKQMPSACHKPIAYHGDKQLPVQVAF